MSHNLWTKNEVLNSIIGELRSDICDNFSSISIDSRTITKGAIFFAIKGEKFDGHDFAQQAYNNGASLLVLQRNKANDLVKSNAPILLVDDTMQALKQLAQAAHKRTKAKIIAITGSVGKTSLKELLYSVLKLYGKSHASYASYNNHWGVPLTLASMPRDTEYGIFELGMNHAGELLELGSMVLPYISIITAIAPAHIGNFANIKAIAAAKSEIYRNQQCNGLALINSDDEYSKFLYDAAFEANIKNIEFFGKSKKANYNFLSYENNIIKSNLGEIKTAPLEEYMGYNIMAILAIIKFLKLNIKKCLDVFKTIAPLAGRGEITTLNLTENSSFIIIDESYNANPASMKQAILSLVRRGQNSAARKVLVLGDMLELGAYSEEMHKKLAQFIKPDQIDLIYLVGNEMKHLALELEKQKKIPYLWSEHIKEILPKVVNCVKANDIIMLKSSNSIAIYKIVAALKEKYR